jgi:hypothetical protein
MGKNRLALHLAAFLVIALFAFLAISSGTVKPLVFDESVPPEQSATIFFYYGVEVTSYNGITIPTKKSINDLGIESEWRQVVLPAGEMELVMDVTASTTPYRTRYIYSYRNVALTYTFEPGEEYIVSFGRIDDIEWVSDRNVKDTKWGIKVNKGNFKKSELLDTFPLSDSGGGGGILLE